MNDKNAKKIGEQLENVERKLDENSLAWECLKSLKEERKQQLKFYKLIVVILTIIIFFLGGYIAYDKYIDSLYDTYSYEQDGDGYNNIVTGDLEGVINNGAETTSENQTES